MDKKFFPIKTATSCQLKWNWTTLGIQNAKTGSCHRTSFSELTVDNFASFHNTPVKLQDRLDMLQGKWPENNCSYCREIEEVGGFSDRMLHLEIPDLSPPELEQDPAAIVVSPSILEVFFNNTCNLSCLYCVPELSSKINQEYKKFGSFVKQGVDLKAIPESQNYDGLLSAFWQWMENHSHTLRRFHVLGGEPFYQEEFYRLMDFFDQTPHPNLEFNIITNLMVSSDRFHTVINRWQSLLSRRHLKRIDITCSIDCWGKEQEYVRWGLNLDQWENNFQTLLEKKWLTVNINQTISVLTIKSMPDLLMKLSQWRKKRPIEHYLAAANPHPTYLMPHILGGAIFEKDFETIISLMPTETKQDLLAVSCMEGVRDRILASDPDWQETKNLRVFLDEKDRRRNTSWRKIFPWLVQEIDHVV